MTARILFLCHSGAVTGGAFYLYLPILDGLRRRGHSIVAGIPPGPSADLLAPHAEALEPLAEEFFPLRFAAAPAAAAAESHALNARLIEEIVGRRGIDVVVSNSGAIRYASDASRASGVPHLQFVQESFTPAWWRRTLDRSWTPTAYAGPGPELLSSEARRSPYYRLPYPRSPAGEGGEGARRRRGIPEDAFVIGMIGTVHRHKRQAEAARFLEDLPDRTDDGRTVLLAFVGPAPDHAYAEGIRRRAEARGTAGRILFAGHVESAAERTALVDIVLVLSRSEGLPLTLLEALDVGRPAVALDVGLVGRVVRDGANGLLAPPGDLAGAFRRLRRVLLDSALRRHLEEGARHLRAPAEHWAPVEETVALYEAAFLDVAGRRAPSSRPTIARLGPAGLDRSTPPAFEAERVLLFQSARREILRAAREAIGRAWPGARVTLLHHADADLPEIARDEDLLYPMRGPYRSRVIDALLDGRAPFDVALVPMNDPLGRGYGHLVRIARRWGRRAEAWTPLGRRRALPSEAAFRARRAVRLVAASVGLLARAAPLYDALQKMLKVADSTEG